MKKRKMICFDMDGTIVDLYNVENWLEKIEKGEVEPYVVAKPLWNMDRLNEIVKQLSEQNWEIRVITWMAYECNKDFRKRIRKAKLDWLKKYDFPMDKAHIITYGATKAAALRGWGEAAILVDDNKKVRQGWTLGRTIDPTDGNLLEELEKLLEV